MNILARVSSDLQDFWSFIRGVYPSMKSARLYGKALRLEKAGRDQEAFAVTTRALASLPEPGALSFDFTVAPRLSLAVLHAQLATRLGTPTLADDEIRKAIQAWGGASEDHPAVREHLNWLRARLQHVDHRQ